MTSAEAASTRAQSVSPLPDPRSAYPGLDSLRGLAAVGVAVYHVAVLSGALVLSISGVVIGRFPIAVPVFFAISGFVLYRPFVVARSTGSPRPNLWRFARRRFARIAPAYWVALGVALLIPGLTAIYAGLAPAGTDQWWRYFGLLQIYRASSAPNGFGHAWTLCVEVTFYLGLAAYVLAIARTTLSRFGVRAELLLLGALAAASVLLRVVTHVDAHGTDGFYPVNLTLAATFLWFAVGMALAVLKIHRPSSGPLLWAANHPNLAWALAVGGFVALCAAGIPRDLTSPFTNTQWAIEHVGYGLVAALMLLPIVAAPLHGGPIGALMRSAALRGLGRVSLGLYLSHLPLMYVWRDAGALHWSDRFPFLILAGLTLVSAAAYGAVSWYGVERPALRIADGLRRGVGSRRR